MAEDKRSESEDGVIIENNEKNEVLLHEGDGLMCTDALTRCKNAVCLIKSETNVPIPRIKRGTGFYAKAKIFNNEYSCIVTNHHVLGCEADARQGTAIFGFEGDNPGKQVELKPDIIFKTNKILDYTVVGLDEGDLRMKCPHVQPLEYVGQPEAERGDDIFIFQHPLGGSKQFSYEKIIAIQSPYVYYSADTDEGSSGSPVLRKFQLMAIHHKGNKEENYNKGTLFSVIIEDLQTGITALSGKRSLTDVINDFEEMEENCVKRKCVEMENGRNSESINLALPCAQKMISTPDDETLDQLSHECVAFYKHLARRLGVVNAKIEAISRDHINYKDDSEKCYQIFQEWRESDCSPFTLASLGKALRSMNKNALANKYCTE